MNNNPFTTTLRKKHQKTSRHYTARWIMGIVLLILLELAYTYIFTVSIHEQQLYQRFTREQSLARNGEISFEDGTYDGETDFGFLTGIGKYSFYTGTTYEGQWANNDFSGDGQMLFPSGGSYVGSFRNSQRDGVGTYIWPDGSSYEGEWSQDIISGSGIYTSPSGTQYDGIFASNAFHSGICTAVTPHGYYKLTFKNGVCSHATITFSDGTTYDGSMSPSFIHGKGILNYWSGDKYSGNFSNGKKNGTGTYSWTNGDVYSGSWSNDKMNGNGKYTFANGSILDGTFRDNTFVSGTFKTTVNQAPAIFTLFSRQITNLEATLSDMSVYSGDVKDGKLTGKATITYPNGDKYTGSVMDGRKSGSGDYRWKSGAAYSGEWNNDRMNGDGIYYFADKKPAYMLKGTFSNGLPSGTCTFYTKQSEYYKTDWKNGKCVKIYE